jgi:ribosome-binding protein aMBF1 (putative translation factor)
MADLQARVLGCIFELTKALQAELEYIENVYAEKIREDRTQRGAAIENMAGELVALRRANRAWAAIATEKGWKTETD